MITFSNTSCGLFRVYVGEGNIGDDITFSSYISRHGRIRQTYVISGALRIIDEEHNGDDIVTGSISELSSRPNYDLEHLTPQTVKFIAIEDNTKFLCVNYKNKKNVKEVKLLEVDLEENQQILCEKRSFVLIKTNKRFSINNTMFEGTQYFNIQSGDTFITAIDKIKVIKFFV